MPGECHYKTGNIQALKRHALLLSMLKTFGIGEDRLRLAWVAAGETDRLVRIFEDMTETLRQLGPLKHS